MDNMNIVNASYLANNDGDNVCIKATIDNAEMYVPLAPGNRHYDEIQRQVAAGTLTIQDAD